MSRSYRKPFVTDGYGTPHRKWAKRQANKKVRRSDEVPDGNAYKKFYCSWNIRDYTFEIPEPIEGGRVTPWGRVIPEEEMIRDYLRATRK